MKSPWMTVPLVVISLIGSPPADADARIATVASALALKDGTAIVVRGAIVESAAAAYIVVGDSVQPLPALVVRPGGYVKVSRFQPVEVSGPLEPSPKAREPSWTRRYSAMSTPPARWSVPRSHPWAARTRRV